MPDRDFAHRIRGVRFGANVDVDERLRPILKREKFFLNIMIPRKRSCRAAMKDWWAVTTKGEGGPFILLLVVAVHAGMIGLCRADSDVCAGALPPDAAALSYLANGGWYAPALLNALAALMIAFYANTCLGLYRDTYSACQSLRHSVQDLSTMACGTIHPDRRQARLEIWRCANLFHLSTYVLADRQRSTYSFENFLLAVAEAFGEHDGQNNLGM